jgi:hypothetical protein
MNFADPAESFDGKPEISRFCHARGMNIAILQ